MTVPYATYISQDGVGSKPWNEKKILNINHDLNKPRSLFDTATMTRKGMKK